MTIQLPSDVKFIMDHLEDNGYEAYAVGGCVRDTLLGRIPQDWDITTMAKPEQVKELFDRTIDTGIAHGTVTIMIGKMGYEVTTYRIDGEYEDARHPKEVIYTANLLEDLKRRDFTINAMAYNERNGLVDAFDGIGDLKEHMIRCVGDAKERFSEDALRMLRAIRFAAQLGFRVEDKTLDAITELSGNLDKVSAERIQVELVKLLVSEHPGEMERIYKTGIAAVILPEWKAMMETPQNNPYHCYNVGRHTICALEQIRADKVLRLSAWLHDIAKPTCRTTDEQGIDHFYGHPTEGAMQAKKLLRRLKFDNATIDAVVRLVAGHDENPALTEKSVRRMIRKTGADAYPYIFELKLADTLAHSTYKREEMLQYLKDYQKLYQQIIDREDCLSLKNLAVNGRDLMELGVKPGQQIGQILNALLELVVEDPEKNTKEYLIGYTLKNLFI